MKRFLAITALVVPVMWSAPLAQEADPSLEKLVQQYAAAFNQSDAKAFAALHTADALRLMSNGVLLSGRAAIEKHFVADRAGAAKAEKLTLRPGETRMLSADVALLAGAFEASGGDAPIKGRYLLTAKREGGQWLLASVVSAREASPK